MKELKKLVKILKNNKKVNAAQQRAQAKAAAMRAMKLAANKRHIR